MSDALFKYVPYSVSNLVDAVTRGTLALPDIQRPFVWPQQKVRDLFDSMYRGYPVGQLMFWKTGVKAGTRQIGMLAKPVAVPDHAIVDGQQRITSLYAIATGHPIVREDFSVVRLKLSFHPQTERFEIPDATTQRQIEWLSDITPLFEDFLETVQNYQDRLEQARGALTKDEQKGLYAVFDRVRDLLKYQFSVVELDADADPESVAEVFVRINSEGVTLNQADFILTMMSVFWEAGRSALEDFARRCVQPSISGPSPFNWYIRPRPAQLVRVDVALAFRRAVLRQVYTILRGRDLATGIVDEDRRLAQYEELGTAQGHVLNLTHWHEFLQCLERAGFRGSGMISSDNAILYSYALWLIGRVNYRVPIDELREVVARWFFMVHTTARYSGSVETQFERDLGTVTGSNVETSAGFCDELRKIISAAFTNDYWSITLPGDFVSSAAKSPALLAYIAALNILDADVLLSTGKVRSRMDPAIVLKKGIERHHLFPRHYLRGTRGVVETRRINQIANMALVDWSDNLTISDLPPSTYWPAELERKRESSGLDESRLERQMYWHALPERWEVMDYESFLSERRRLMATVVRDAFAHLSSSGYVATYPVVESAEWSDVTPAWVHHGIGLKDLINGGLLTGGSTLVGEGDGGEVCATVLEDGQVEYEDEVYASPSGAAGVARGGPTNGWTFWSADTPSGMRALRDLRGELASQSG
jgi:hypothetical protein